MAVALPVACQAAAHPGLLTHCQPDSDVEPLALAPWAAEALAENDANEND